MDVRRAKGRFARDARDPPRRARHGSLESPSDARSIGQGRDARFFLGSPSRRHVEGDDARHTHLALLQLRHHIGRDQVDGDAEVGSHPSPRRRHRHQACPTRSDGVWRRGRLSCSLLSRSRQSDSPECLTRTREARSFRRRRCAFQKGALEAPCVTTTRARQLGSPWRPARVRARGVCSARSARRTLPCPRFVPACRAGDRLKYLAPLNVRMSFSDGSRRRAQASRRVFRV